MSFLSRRPRLPWAPALLLVLSGMALPLVTASVATAAPTAPASPVAACAEGTQVLNEDFSDNTLPAGWSAKAGTWQVTDGRLVGSGAASASNPTRIVTNLPHLNQYCLDFTMRFTSVTNSARWAGAILDVAPSATGGPWQHAMMRQNGTVAFGTRNAANTDWGSDITGTRQSALTVGTDVHLTMLVSGTHGEIWLTRGTTAPVKIDSTDKLQRTATGTIGFLLDGATVQYDDIVVTDLSPTPDPNPAPTPDPTPTPSVPLPPSGGAVVTSDDFSSNVMPAGWTPMAGTWSVHDGRLYGSGPNSASNPTRLIFGTSLPDYRFDATVRFESVVNATRWAGLILDHSSTSTGPWQHAMMRVNSTAVGFGTRNAANSGWGKDILGSAPPAADPIAVGKDIHMSVVVQGTHGEWWYQTGTMPYPVLLAQTDALTRTGGGTLGFVLDGATVSFDNVVVTNLSPNAAACQPYNTAVAQAAATSPDGSAVLNETFATNADAACWTKSGSWAVTGGELVGTSTAVASPAAVRFGPHLTNYSLTATVRTTSVAGTNGTISFGADVPANSGTWTDGVFPASSFPVGTSVNVRIDVQGRSVTYYLNGTQVRTTLLAVRSTNGVVGIQVAGATVAFDDITITKLAVACIAPDRVPTPGQTGLAIAHRGNDGNDGIPDNVIPGFANAFAHGADFFEDDIYITTDGVPVVRHDSIGSITIAQFHAKYPTLPTLEEVLQFQQKTHAKELLEYKGVWTIPQVTIVRDLIQKYGEEDDIISQSFEMTTLDNIHAVDPDMRIMLVSNSLGSASSIVATATQHHLYGINPGSTPTAAQVAALHAAGKRIFVWTVGPSSFAKLTDLGVDGIITNDSGALVTWYAAYNADRGLQTCYSVTVTTGEGGVSATPDVTQQAAGKPVTVTAVAQPGYHFAGLTGISPEKLALTGADQFTMPTQTTQVKAVFLPDTTS